MNTNLRKNSALYLLVAISAATWIYTPNSYGSNAELRHA